MSNHKILPLLLALLLVPAGVPATASAAGATTAGKATQSRPRYAPRTYRRPFPPRRFFGGLLKALGLAYLFHLLFGWGAGGSPLGLLLIVAFVAWLVTRRRRRLAYRY